MTKKLTILAGKHMTYQYTLPQLHRCVTEVRSAMPPTHSKLPVATIIYTNILHNFQFISIYFTNYIKITSPNQDNWMYTAQ